MSTLTITLPLPPKECSPNSRFGPIARNKAMQEAKGWAVAMAKDAMNKAAKAGCPWVRLEQAVACATFYWPVIRTRDRSNASASLKAYEDGFTKAGVWLDDSGVHWGFTSFSVDAKNPRVEITIRALDAGEGGE